MRHSLATEGVAAAAGAQAAAGDDSASESTTSSAKQHQADSVQGGHLGTGTLEI